MNKGTKGKKGSAEVWIFIIIVVWVMYSKASSKSKVFARSLIKPQDIFVAIVRFCEWMASITEVYILPAIDVLFSLNVT